MMSERTPEGESATDVILAVFEADGAIGSAGERLAAEQGLSAARWKVLGAIALADRPLTVPQVARRMGLTRQSVHRTTGQLVDEGLVEFEPNKDHQRSPLVRLTEQGQERYAAVDKMQVDWVNQLAAEFSVGDLNLTATILGQLTNRLESEE